MVDETLVEDQDDLKGPERLEAPEDVEAAEGADDLTGQAAVLEAAKSDVTREKVLGAVDKPWAMEAQKEQLRDLVNGLQFPEPVDEFSDPRGECDVTYKGQQARLIVMKIGDDVSVDIYGGEDRPLGVSIKSDESYLVSENGNIFDVDSAGKLKGSEGRTVMPATVEAIFQSAIDLVEANKAGLES